MGDALVEGAMSRHANSVSPSPGKRWADERPMRITRAQELALLEAAVASGRVTVLPPAGCAPAPGVAGHRASVAHRLRGDL